MMQDHGMSLELRTLDGSLRSKFAENPVEAGLNHGAEEVLRSAITHRPEESERYLVAQARQGSNFPFRCDLIKVMGRLPRSCFSDQVIPLALELLQEADVEIREAAVQLAEEWRDLRFADALEMRQESVPWLANYARQVAAEIRR